MSKQDILAAMHYYSDLGLPIIPTCTADTEQHDKITSEKHKKMCRCAGKTPLIAGWTTRAETTKEDIKEWYTSFTDMNIGLPLGSASGFCGIDIDGAEGEQLFAEMSKGDAPETWEYATGDGRRLLYKIPVGMKTKKFKQTGESKHSECAILCQGQHTVLPPSRHYSGKSYTWTAGKTPKDIDCAMAPKWLLTLIKDDRSQTKGMVLNLTQDTKDALQFSELFDGSSTELEDFNGDTAPKRKEIKGAQVASSIVDGILEKVISEGGRDNAMTQVIGHYMAKPEYRALPPEVFFHWMMQYNQQYMDPPLDEAVIKQKCTHFSMLEAQKDAHYKELVNEKKFIVPEVVQMVMNRFESDGYIIRYDRSLQTYYYSKTHTGPWIKDDDGFIESMIYQYLKDPVYADPKWCTKQRRQEISEALINELRYTGKAAAKMFDLNEHAAELSSHLVVDGKLLDWRTGEMSEWSDNYYTTNSFDINYDPQASCPHWEAYLKDWLPDEASRNLIQEFVGSALIPEPAPEEKFLILNGGGSNGKSMLMYGIEQIFDTKVCAHTTPQKLGERFGVVALYGKLLNICSEIDGEGKRLNNSAQLKAIVSGESLTAEFKGRDTFTFKPVANLMFSCNSVPKTVDKTAGWTRRQMIIKFEKTFTPNSKVGYEMKKNMLAEKAGIFNWMLEGLRRIKSRGYFIVPEAVQEAADDFVQANDPIAGFVQNCLRKNVTLRAEFYEKFGKNRNIVGTPTKVVHKIYTMWCIWQYGDKHEQYKRSVKTFSEELSSRNLTAARGCSILKGNQTLCWSDVEIDIRDEALLEHLYEQFNDPMSEFSDDKDLMEIRIHIEAKYKQLFRDEE